MGNAGLWLTIWTLKFVYSCYLTSQRTALLPKYMETHLSERRGIVIELSFTEFIAIVIDFWYGFTSTFTTTDDSDIFESTETLLARPTNPFNAAFSLAESFPKQSPSDAICLLQPTSLQVNVTKPNAVFAAFPMQCITTKHSSKYTLCTQDDRQRRR